MTHRQDDADAPDGTVRFRSLHRNQSTAFLVAAGLLGGFVVSNGLEAFTSTTPPTWVNTAFVSPALVAAAAGLLGFYPTHARRHPAVALLGAAVVSFAAVAAVALGVTTSANALASGVRLPFGPVYLVTLFTTILGFVTVGVTSLWTAVPSRTVGLLVLGPPAVNVVMFVTAPMNLPQWTTFLFSALFMGAVLALGLALRRGFAQPDDAHPVTGPTAR